MKIDDPQAFLRNTDAFYFQFSKKHRPTDLIEKLRKAGDGMGIALYHFYTGEGPTSFNPGKKRPALELISNRQQKEQDLNWVNHFECAAKSNSVK